MQRRDFLSAALGAGALSLLSPTLAVAAPAAGRYQRLLILVELKGGNDGLNTVVPHADPAYYALRPEIGIKPEGLIVLDEKSALHKSLEPLMPLWGGGEMAIMQGVGYPQPNLSHFRSIEIWDTASKSDEYLQQGWLTRVFKQYPAPQDFSADALVVGSADLGPVAGGARAIALQDPAAFNRNARLAQAMQTPGGGALAHVLKVERDIAQAARSIGNKTPTTRTLKTVFPDSGFGRTCKAACETLASAPNIAVMRLTLGGFDTHQNQLGTHANLLKQFADGVVALQAALTELGRWDDTLILSYSEFGRRPKQNQSAGTDHGTVAPHFAFGGGVQGGMYGHTPSLAELDDSGNLKHVIDFHSVYATVMERWWELPSEPLLGARFQPLAIV
ncbi:DUF1501 domain-containing protein [Uliginosibacterium sp. H1]|uniref:DUF1501 domain-containing protein n=1 Tax=Uliginosibacterium sp. H1 TaxID=3114757 RepID=UPI002E18E130|nr:DUF1501 domain-containing protein [Uliginosibacterium sp. H1]